MRPRIAAVVCTHNRANLLSKCLESLVAQSLPGSQFEILVVDNLSTDDTAAVVRRYADTHPNVRYLYHERLGLASSRNAAIAATEAEIVAFTDDDAEVYPDWLERFLGVFDLVSPTPCCAGGEIEPVWGAPRPLWLGDRFLHPRSARLDWSDRPIFLKDGQWICEVNSAYRRQLLVEFGGFVEELGRKGNLLLSGENYVNERMCQAGHKIYFDPGIRVKHYIHPERLTKHWLRKRWFWQGVTHGVIMGKERAAGTQTHGWTELCVPASTQEWIDLFDDSNDPELFSQSCDRMFHLGLLLSVKKLIDA
jgi:glycosyltransferase involved in cell wall biosynthesis